MSQVRRVFANSFRCGSGTVTFGVFDRRMREPVRYRGLDTNDGTWLGGRHSDPTHRDDAERDANWWDALMRGRAVLSFADVIHRPEWHARSACRDLDPDTFFPETPASEAEAKLICAGCPVRSECLDHAVDRDIRYGVWGGLAPRERQFMQDRPAVRDLVVRRTRTHLRAL